MKGLRRVSLRLGRITLRGTEEGTNRTLLVSTLTLRSLVLESRHIYGDFSAFMKRHKLKEVQKLFTSQTTNYEDHN